MASMEKASWLGVMTAAATARTRIAQRRFLRRNLSSIDADLGEQHEHDRQLEDHAEGEDEERHEGEVVAGAQFWTLKKPALNVSRKARPLGSTRK